MTEKCCKYLQTYIYIHIYIHTYIHMCIFENGRPIMPLSEFVVFLFFVVFYTSGWSCQEGWLSRCSPALCVRTSWPCATAEDLVGGGRGRMSPSMCCALGCGHRRCLLHTQRHQCARILLQLPDPRQCIFVQPKRSWVEAIVARRPALKGELLLSSIAKHCAMFRRLTWHDHRQSSQQSVPIKNHCGYLGTLLFASSLLGT